ncbi:PTS sugar transporter subunit IIB [Erysipelothrix sp. D19-032]
MKESRDSQGYEVEISTHSVSEAARVGADADIVLLGPQVRFNLSTVQKQLPEKPIEVIDMRAYGTMNGEAVIAEVKKVLGD